MKILLSTILEKKHPIVLKNLIDIFDKFNISYELIDNCKDIWIRDFMPFYLDNKTLVSYIYEPDYLQDEKYSNLKTKIEPLENHLDLVIDGGNFVRYKNKAIMTEKVFNENKHKYSKVEIINLIKEKCKLDELIIIPKQPYDIYGHSDSMVRWIDENRVVINDFSNESKIFQTRLIDSLKSVNLKVEQLSYKKDFFTKKRNWGAYLNYLEFNDLIIMPVYGIANDLKVWNHLKNVFPHKEIKILQMNQIIENGGALHCITSLKGDKK